MRHSSKKQTAPEELALWLKLCFEFVCLGDTKVPIEALEKALSHHEIPFPKVDRFVQFATSRKWVYTYSWFDPSIGLSPSGCGELLEVMHLEDVADPQDFPVDNRPFNCPYKQYLEVLRFIVGTKDGLTMLFPDLDDTGAIPGIFTLFNALLYRPKLQSVFASLPGPILSRFIDFELSWHDEDVLEQLDYFAPIIKEYKERNAGSAPTPQLHDFYEFRYEFKQKGHPEERLVHMHTSTPEYCLMRAILLFSSGQDVDAYEFIREALKRRCCGRDFNDPFEQFLFVLALFRNRNISTALKRLHSTLKRFSTASIEQFGAWPLLVTGCVEDTDFLLKRLQTDFDILPPTTKALVHLTIANLHLSENVDQEFPFPPPLLEVPFWKLQYEAFHNPTAPATMALKESLGNCVLLRPVARKPRWESLVDALIEQQQTLSKISAPQKKRESRIIYLLDTESEKVVPREQKCSASGVWSVGKDISLKSFVKKASDYEGIDKKIASLVQIERWGSTLYYSLEGSSIIEALIGHPNVYSPNMKEHLEVVRKDPQVIVTRTENGGFVPMTNIPKTGVDFDHRTIIEYDAPNHRVSVITVNEQQAKILRPLLSIEEFPSEAEKKLTLLLEKISVDIGVTSDLLKNSTQLQRLRCPSTVALQLEQTQPDIFIAQACVHPESDPTCRFVPGLGLAYLTATIGGKTVQIERRLAEEEKHFKALLDALESLGEFREDSTTWALNTEACLRMLEILAEHSDHVKIEWPQGAKLRIRRASVGSDSLNLSLHRIDQWFEIEGVVKIDQKTKVSISELLGRIREDNNRFVSLNGTDYITLTESLRKQFESLESLCEISKNDVRMSIYNAPQLEAVREQGLLVDTDENYTKLLHDIQSADTLHAHVPEQFRGELRDYQIEGFEWMARFSHWGAGTCLADDMGLGKTVQAIALLQYRASLGASLVLVPTAVLFNWKSEFERFAPGLHVIVFNEEDRETALDSIGAGDIVLATYGVLINHVDKLNALPWNVVLLDEAHAIKNRETKTAKCVRTLKAQARVALTGTPIQNHLSEIWNLFEFTNPGLLGTSQSFTERFIIPIEANHDKTRQRQLKRLITPFILRRTKLDVLSELPSKTETLVRVTLSKPEMALYEQLRNEAIQNLKEKKATSIQALALLMKLRLAACHPQLVDPKLELESAKTQALLELIEGLLSNKHKALVFSQFTSHLSLIRSELDKRKIAYFYLDGSTSAAERIRLVNAFQDGTVPLFLISLKAGGIGLNLTAADYVIHLNPWWNPAVEDQASDRIYRIGQKQPVTVYRLIAANTIEEKILELHQSKRSLADTLLEGADSAHKLNKEEILALLTDSVGPDGTVPLQTL